MKENLPFNILLAVTIAVTGLMVGYNLFLRESFPVMVRYDFPQVADGEPSLPQPEAAPLEEPDVFFHDPETAEEPDVFNNDPEVMEDPEDFYLEPEVSFEAPSGASDEFYEEPGEDEVFVQFPLDLNKAVYEELILIPRVGDVTAQRILQYRDYLGGYEKLEQLMDIKGIGEATFERISPYLYVD